MFFVPPPQDNDMASAYKYRNNSLDNRGRTEWQDAVSEYARENGVGAAQAAHELSSRGLYQRRSPRSPRYNNF